MVDQIRVKGGVLLGALVSGALAAGTLTGAPTANANCASFFGIGNTADCTSTLTTIAIAIGTGAQAHADGLFGSAFAVGTGARAFTDDAFTFATAVGDGAVANTDGLFGITAALGQNAYALTAGSHALPGGSGQLGLNIAINITPASPNLDVVEATGIADIAVNLFGPASKSNPYVIASGYFNTAVNVLGTDNTVLAGDNKATVATGSLAFNAFGSGNVVSAQPGPFAIAGAIGETGQSVTKAGPGIAIGTRVGGAAAVKPKNSAPTAAATPTGNTTAAPATAAHTPTQKKAPAATATSRGNR